VSGPGLPINFSTNLNYSPRLARELAQFPLLHIICSVDGWDDDSYAEYRWGGRFDFVRQNLAILGQGKCTVYPQYLVSDDHDDPEGRKRKFLAFVQDTIGTTKNVLFKKKQADLRNDTGAHVPGRCSSLYGGLYFNSDGTLMPCCTNVGKDVMLRHISTYTSEELRGGADIASLRRRILDDKDQFASCRSCAGEDVQQVTLTAIAHRVKGMFISLRPLPGTSKSL
jgi:hypothetical protein